MNYLLFIIVFFIVLFFYIHIYYQLNTNDDLEIYEINEPTKDKLEEICDLKQPIMFKYLNDNLMTNCNLINLGENYNVFDINIRNNENNELFVPLQLKDSIELFNNDNKSKYISENNEDFLKETTLIKYFKVNDEFLRPPLVSKCIYDFMTGSKNSHTPLRYDLNYRNYYLVTQGEIKVILIPPKYSKYLYLEKDYLNFEFYSQVNCWEPQDKYKNDFNKLKKLELTLKEGDLLFIPSYWWYSIRFNEISSVCCFKYRTYINTLSILPQLCIYMLQNMNVKHNLVKIKDKIEY